MEKFFYVGERGLKYEGESIGDDICFFHFPVHYVHMENLKNGNYVQLDFISPSHSFYLTQIERF